MTLFALVDANNFYASCESIFAPKLQGQPLLVLSNNDGCIIARSAEAKALGFPMGAPIHQWREQCRAHGVIIKSSNYTLYGDMSRRLLSELRKFSSQVESYSIDECFLALGITQQSTVFARELRTHIAQALKIRCGVGIAPTKTLAKLANHWAKRHPQWQGVFNVLDHQPALIAQWMQQTDIAEVWGVGRRLAPRLAALGMTSVYDLQQADVMAVQREFGVTLARTVRELRGESCLSLQELAVPRQHIVVSRSFGRRLQDKPSVQSAITRHIARAVAKLRGQGSLAQALSVMLESGRLHTPSFQRDQQWCLLPAASADTSVFLQAATALLHQLYHPERHYRKAGVMLADISAMRGRQLDSFSDLYPAHRERLMRTLDGINAHYGDDTLFMAPQALSQRWQMRSEQRSPSYTTRVAEVPTVYAN